MNEGDGARGPGERFEETATKVEPSSKARQDGPPSSAEPIGVGIDIAGRYHLERKLGSGGMGDVFLAKDSAGGRKVAVKILHHRMAGNLTVVSRFRREARVMREIASKHAVSIHDFGQTESGALYLVMAYLEGETLGDLLQREGPLEGRRVVDIALALLDVLGDAHRRGVIHRDLKPQNVFLAKEPGAADAVVKLLDFGVAKLQDEDGTQLTETGAVWGTPRYMSPEQARGKPIDKRSDLYSLGVLMYRALTGLHPYDGESAAELAYALVRATPEAPGKRRPDLGIPPELGRVVMRALEKEPDARYASAAEMADDLRAIRDAKPSAPAPSEGRATKLVVRAFIAATALLTLTCLLEIPTILRAPFPGFAVESGLLVSALIDRSWPGIERGIEPYDAVVAVDGKPVGRGRDVHAYVRPLPLGTPVTYTLRREERTFDVVVPVSPLRGVTLLKLYGSGLLAAIGFFLVGGVVGWKRPSSRPVHALLMFTSSLGALLAVSLDLDFMDRFAWVFRFGLCMASGAPVHLGLVFPDLSGDTQRRPWVLGSSYLPGLVLFAVWQSLGDDPVVGGVCTRVGLALFLVGLVGLLGSLAHARLRGKTLSLRQSARFMLWAGGLAILPAVVLAVVPIALGVQTAAIAALSWIGMLALTLFPLAFAFQIQRGQMFDVDVALSEIAAWLVKLVALLLVFSAAALPFGGLARAFDSPPAVRYALGAAFGVAAVVALAEPISSRLRKRFERRADLDGGAVFDELTGATQGALSVDEIIEPLFEILRRSYSPRSLVLLEWDGAFYRAHTIGSPLSRSAPDVERSQEARELLAGGTLDEIRRRFTKLGHFDAHASLVVPLDAGDAQAAPAAVIVVGARVDGRAYASYDATLVAGLARIASLRLSALGESARAERRRLLERCFGPGHWDPTSPDAELAFGPPARGMATALVLRFSGLDKAAESLSPRSFKSLVDDLFEAAGAAAFEQRGTLHSLRGDEMLFGFGALFPGPGAGEGEASAIAAAFSQVRRTSDVARRHGAPSVRARVAAARGPLTVGTFGPPFRADCLIVGSAIHEATELVNAARDGEVVVDDDIAKVAEASGEPYRIERMSTGGAARLVR